jgi:signal transduction histidine kinase
VRRQRGFSLRWRLLAMAAGLIALALVLSWIALSLLFERHAERQVEADLVRHAQSLVAGTELAAGGAVQVRRPPADPRFVRPASGLYWRITAPGTEVRSRSLWDGRWPSAAGAGSPGWRFATTPGPFEPRMIRVMRTIRPDAAGPALLVEVGIDHGQITQARAGFARELAVFLLVLWVALTGAALAQVLLGLAPLGRVRRDLDSLMADARARLDPLTHPREIAPLAEAINQLADARAADMLAARERARDLAHALKTPLTALRLQVEGLPATQRDGMEQAMQLLTGAVQAELARSAPTDAAGSVRLAQVIARLVAVVERTPSGARCRFQTDLPADLTIPMTEAAALEAFGALLDNAARHAATTVRISGNRSRAKGVSETSISITDDGPGIPETARAAVLGRGVRLDQASGTQGLGLAIARACIESSGGALSLGTSDAGGLAVKACWQVTSDREE